VRKLGADQIRHRFIGEYEIERCGSPKRLQRRAARFEAHGWLPSALAKAGKPAVELSELPRGHAKRDMSYDDPWLRSPEMLALGYQPVGFESSSAALQGFGPSRSASISYSPMKRCRIWSAPSLRTKSGGFQPPADHPDERPRWCAAHAQSGCRRCKKMCCEAASAATLQSRFARVLIGSLKRLQICRKQFSRTSCRDDDRRSGAVEEYLTQNALRSAWWRAASNVADTRG